MLEPKHKQFALDVAEYVRDYVPGYDSREKFHLMQDVLLAVLDDEGMFEAFLDCFSDRHWSTIQKKNVADKSSTELRWADINRSHHGRKATVGLKNSDSGLFEQSTIVIGRIDYPVNAARPVLWDHNDAVQVFAGDYFVVLDD